MEGYLQCLNKLLRSQSALAAGRTTGDRRRRVEGTTETTKTEGSVCYGLGSQSSDPHNLGYYRYVFVRVSHFARIFPLRAPNVMWLLGAGASASAGVPTADHMVWEFKRAIYCTEQHVSISTASDLGDTRLLARIQQYLDGTGRFPPARSAEEYPAYFEAVYPSEADRRRHIDRCATSP
jgi:hypothetical protein